MKRTLATANIVLVVALLLGGCNLPNNGATPTAGPNAVNTAAALTVIAMTTQFAPQATTAPSSSTTVPTNVNQSVVPTIPPENQSTATPAATALSAATATTIPVVAAAPCNRAAFLSDVTYPDGSVVAPSTTFTKTWSLQNTGTCTWSTGYMLAFVNGDAMEGPASVNLPSSIAPNSSINISVTLRSPKNNGSYKGYWDLQDNNGVSFGLDPNAKTPFWVQIVVGPTPSATTGVGTGTPAPFAVNHVNGSVNNSNKTVTTSPCSYKFTFSADVTTTAAGTVTYHWVRSDGATSGNSNITFTGPGTQTVTTTWTLGSSYTGWEALFVDVPNHQQFGNINFKLTCP
ncbi:MAG: NBR1-Ig-like domain-containing protein [Anaerolineaceae bacterium]|nr:NBR1-Ig-like domain-containing protein [Anaerolineaceae bacterium]